ncbi:uncharacterized protein VTP21DRAFT_2264 [Calcarisporiella thermophila]|uniref:uncharacterized protein n=1 Tax=Calcarisporiella thermophila TaxID=911321 RepID=UPI003742DA5E
MSRIVELAQAYVDAVIKMSDGRTELKEELPPPLKKEEITEKMRSIIPSPLCALLKWHNGSGGCDLFPDFGLFSAEDIVASYEGWIKADALNDESDEIIDEFVNLVPFLGGEDGMAYYLYNRDNGEVGKLFFEDKVEDIFWEPFESFLEQCIEYVESGVWRVNRNGVLVDEDVESEEADEES